MESQELGRKVQFFISGKLYDMILYSAIQLKLCFGDIILIIIVKYSFELYLTTHISNPHMQLFYNKFHKIHGFIIFFPPLNNFCIIVKFVGGKKKNCVCNVTAFKY